MSFHDIAQFHFLRPIWLTALLPAFILWLCFWHQKNRAINWRGAIDPNLLGHLLEDSGRSSPRWPWLLLLLAWLLSCIAMAGPSWQKIPQPVHQKQDGLVIVIDLSLSMYAEDIKPSRLTRAQHKVLDILDQRKEGMTALIAYSGDAHVVSPLSDDNKTIANLLPALTPDMMPVFGSNPVAAVKLARQLFANAGLNNGRLLLISDEITERNSDDISEQLEDTNIELSILGIGTETGAPIPTGNGFLKDDDGSIVTPQLHRNRFEQLAAKTQGRYTDVTLDDKDLAFLLPPIDLELEQNTRLTDRESDQWRDHGPLLTLLLLPLAALAFRRGWLLLLPLLLIFESPKSVAFEWQDLWQTADQQGQQLLEQGDAKQAAKTFKNPDWQGAANYRDGNYKDALKAFEKNNDAISLYNQANALARDQKLEKAIERYQQALDKAPHLEDAQFNKDLLEQLLEQQKQQQQDGDQDNEQQQGEQEQDQNGNQQSEQPGNQGQDQNDQQPGDQNNSDQQQKDGSPSDSNENNDGDKNDSNNQNQSDNSPEQTPEPQNNQSEQKQEQEQEQEQEQNQSSAEQQQQEQLSEAQQQAAKEEAEQQAAKQQQATERWLRQIPDDPSGLLRRKFRYQHQLRRGEQRDIQEEQPLW